MDTETDSFREEGTSMAEDKSVDERVRDLEVAQATQAAGLAGAEATQAATTAGMSSTMAAMNAGTMATMAAGGVSLVVGIFLGIAIARSK
jgi:hypothetical protein